MEWPPYSPDLNPIEHLWDNLGSAVNDLQPRPHTVQTLEQALLQCWLAIPPELICRLIQSMNSRCREDVQSRGGHTHY